jgi:hypothetical protein
LKKGNEMHKPVVIIFHGPNGVGKTTQGKLLTARFNDRGILAEDVDSWGDLIQPRVYPEGTEQDWEFRFQLHTQGGVFSRTRFSEREINKTGQFNSPDWVSWLACRAIRERLVDGIVPIMTGTSRTPLEAQEVAAEIILQHRMGIAAGVVIVGLGIDIELAKQRIRDRMPTLPAAQQEKEQYKIDKMPERFGWYFNETVPAIAQLKEFLSDSATPLWTVDVTDDGSLTREAISERIWAELLAHQLV